MENYRRIRTIAAVMTVTATASCAANTAQTNPVPDISASLADRNNNSSVPRTEKTATTPKAQTTVKPQSSLKKHGFFVQLLSALQKPG